VGENPVQQGRHGRACLRRRKGAFFNFSFEVTAIVKPVRAVDMNDLHFRPLFVNPRGSRWMIADDVVLPEE